jgi:hypothetical protein
MTHFSLIGLVISIVSLYWPPWIIGLFFGLLLSAPSAIVTKAWGPIRGFAQLAGPSSAPCFHA